MEANSQQNSVLEETYGKIKNYLEINNFPVGTKLQPIRNIAKEFNVSYLTAQKAVKALQVQGALEARRGDGLYVAGESNNLSGKFSDADIRQYLSNKKQKMCSLCVVLPFWATGRRDSAVFDIIRGILVNSDKNDWSVELIYNSGTEDDFESSHPDFLRKIEMRKPNGVVWIQPRTVHKMNIMRLIDRGYEVVITGRNFKDIPAKCIQMDMGDLARKTVKYLMSKGSENFVMITAPIIGMSKDQHSIDIVEAIQKEAKKRGISMPYDRICQAAFAPARSAIVESFFESHRDLDGIICLHEDILEEIEKIDKNGLFEKRTNRIPMVDTTGIFNFNSHKMKNIEMVLVEWPLENMGRAVIQEFEKKWKDNIVTEPIDLGVEILK